MCSLAALFLFTWPPVEWLISRPLEAWYPIRPLPPAEADAIVVLNSKVSTPIYERPFPLPDFDTYSRTRFAAWLHQHWKPLPVLAVAGAGGGAPAMCELLTSSGVPDTQIWVEERSRSTYENALYGGRILREHAIGRIALVVDARSMVRAAACFRKQGFEVVAAPAISGSGIQSAMKCSPVGRPSRATKPRRTKRLGCCGTGCMAGFSYAGCRARASQCGMGGGKKKTQPKSSFDGENCASMGAPAKWAQRSRSKTMREIFWATRDQWNYAAYSLNTRLEAIAGNQHAVDGLSKECRQKFGADCRR
jgi:uncharacterized SAM-binding protein YcdF (DUF218 family)